MKSWGKKLWIPPCWIQSGCCVLLPHHHLELYRMHHSAQGCCAHALFLHAGGDSSQILYSPYTWSQGADMGHTGGNQVWVGHGRPPQVSGNLAEFASSLYSQPLLFLRLGVRKMNKWLDLGFPWSPGALPTCGLSQKSGTARISATAVSQVWKIKQYFKIKLALLQSFCRTVSTMEVSCYVCITPVGKYSRCKENKTDADTIKYFIKRADNKQIK